MNSRFRSLLPALAPAFLVLATAATEPSLGLGSAGVESAAAATAGHPSSEGRQIEDAEAPLSVAERAAKIAQSMVGTPYRWGGESPSGFDCSGLVRWAYGRVGVELPHSSYALYSLGRGVSRGKMKAGDVLVFEGLGHVGLYLERGRMVHAPYSGRDVEVVRLADWYGSRLVGARRVTAA
jgi:cell wall-associated NlpC family hydrolase